MSSTNLPIPNTQTVTVPLPGYAGSQLVITNNSGVLYFDVSGLPYGDNQVYLGKQQPTGGFFIITGPTSVVQILIGDGIFPSAPPLPNCN